MTEIVFKSLPDTEQTQIKFASVIGSTYQRQELIIRQTELPIRQVPFIGRH